MKPSTMGVISLTVFRRHQQERVHSLIRRSCDEIEDPLVAAKIIEWNLAESERLLAAHIRIIKSFREEREGGDDDDEKLKAILSYPETQSKAHAEILRISMDMVENPLIAETVCTRIKELLDAMDRSLLEAIDAPWIRDD